MGNIKIRHARFETELETFSATRNASLRSPRGTSAGRRAIAASVIVAAALSVLGGSPLASANTAATWTDNGGSGDNNWFTASNWDINAAPYNNGSITYAVTDNISSALNLNGSATIDSLNVGGVASLNILGGNGLTIATNVGVTNNGTITVNSDQYHGSVLTFSGGTLTGTGTVVLNAGGATAQLNGTLTQDVQQSILGLGQINAALTNDGIVNANVSGQTLTLQTSAMTNNNFFEATGGGTLEISGITLAQGTTGQVLANGGTVNIDGNATIVGGALNTSNGGSINNFAGTNTLTNVTSNGVFNILGGTDTNVSGNLTNNGTITVNSDQYHASVLTFVDSNGNQTLTGNGTVVLNSYAAQLDTTNGSTLTVDTHQTVEGQGQINAALINNGTINANVSGGTLTLLTNSMTNNSMIESTVPASGSNPASTLEINGITLTQGTNGQVLANGGAVNIDGNATIVGGTLNTSNGGSINNFAGTNTLTNVTSNGVFNITGGTTTDVSGNLTNNGTITVNSDLYHGSALTFVDSNGNQTLTGTGTVVLDVGGGGANLNTANGSTLTIDTHQTVEGQGQINATLINNGTVNANSSGNTLAITNTNTNNGTYEASNGGTLAVSNLTNYSAGTTTLTGGTYEVAANSTMILPGSVTTNAATIILNGANTAFAAISTMTANTGTLKLENGATFATAGNFTNSGTLSLDPSTLNVAGNLVLNNTSTFDMGIAGTHTGQFDTINVNGGSATIAGTLSLSLENGFTASVGESFVFLDATGGVTGTFTNAGPYDVNGYVFDLVKTSPNDLSLQVGAVPEPTTLGLLAIGGLGLLVRRRKTA